MNLLENKFYTLSEVFIVELLLTVVIIYQLYEYLLELMKNAKELSEKIYKTSKNKRQNISANWNSSSAFNLS